MRSEKGFTLLEIMIVLGILAGLMALAVPRFQSNKNKIKTVVRQFGALTKEVRNTARLKKVTYRIAFKFGKPSSFWIEAASGNEVVPSKETLENLRRLSEKDRPPDPFKKVDRPMKEKELDSGLTWKSVETTGSDGIVENGIAYVYYSPEGLVEKSIIQIQSEKQQVWSFIINPLTGHLEFVEGSMNLKDLTVD
jgi:general secretion pathway protein H